VPPCGLVFGCQDELRRNRAPKSTDREYAEMMWGSLAGSKATTEGNTCVVASVVTK
jgi:hypothetical protein